jgi:membrane protein DedA with SNARE-associated domain
MIENLNNVIIIFGALGVFLAFIIEEVVVFIPSVLVHIGAGAIILGGQAFTIGGVIKLLLVVALPSALGVTIGSLWIYYIAYYGGIIGLKTYGKYFFVSSKKIEEAREKIANNKNTVRAITILRFLPIFPNTVVTACAGILRLSFKNYFISTMIGIFIRATYLGAIGWFFGKIILS